jgi:hypothetical protein
MVGAVGIGLKAALQPRKLLIQLNASKAKKHQFAQPRYTAGTRTLKDPIPGLMELIER